MLRPCCALWLSEPVVASLASSRTFLECLLADSHIDSSVLVEGQVSSTRELHSALSAIVALGKRFKMGSAKDCSPVFRDKWPALLPVLFQLLCVLHGMMEPASKMELCKGSDSSWAYVISSEESVSFLGSGIAELQPSGLTPTARQGFRMYTNCAVISFC